MWQLTYDNIPATIKSSLMLGKEAMEKASTNTVSLMLAQNSQREPYQGPKIWNKLKTDVKNKTNIFSFKRFLKNEFLEKDLSH